MHDPREPQLTAMKCMLHYLRGTPDFGLLLRRSSGSDLVAYTTPLVSWSAKRQIVVSRSSVEVEYRAVANGVTEATWLRQLLHELQTPLSRCTLIYCDNIRVVYLSINPVQHQRPKHV
jgi:hypothetical protein